MSFSELELKRIEKLAEAFLEQRRPPVHLRKELDLGFRIDGNSIIMLPKGLISKKVPFGKFTGKEPILNGMVTSRTRK